MLTFGDIFTFLQVNGASVHLYILKGPTWDYSISLLANPAGGFFVFGVIMAVLAYKNNKKKDKEAAERRAKAYAAANAAPKPAPKPEAVVVPTKGGAN